MLHRRVEGGQAGWQDPSLFDIDLSGVGEPFARRLAEQHGPIADSVVRGGFLLRAVRVTSTLVPGHFPRIADWIASDA